MKCTGPAFLWNRTASDVAVRSFDEAFDLVRAELALASGSGDAAEVFSAHLEMLEDPMLREAVDSELAAGKQPLEAVDAACSCICAMFADIDDEYLRARVDDVRDVFARLREAMCGGSAVREIPAGSVIVSTELLPSDTARIDFSSISGILCARGSVTSHVCIIAHAHGVPIRVGADISGICEGDIVEVDDPLVGGTANVVAQVRAAGRRVYANAGSVEEVRAAIAAGADGIGLFRTEFLFIGRECMPSEDEQRALYREALGACGGKPLTIRLLDIGGDKSLPYLPVPVEDNPFLGLRGIRFLLAHPELAENQLRALAAAACEVRDAHPDWFAFGTPVRVMLPMVCTVDEVRRVRSMLAGVAGETCPVEVGIMVETPAAVLCAQELAAECDFFSIGTNDLTQYVMAADRGNASVGSLYDAQSPAVRRAVALTVAAAHSAVRPSSPVSAACPSGIPVGICGELASDPSATSWLLASGLDSFSLSRL